MSKPLRIAVWHNLPSGGAKRALYNQIKGLLGRGHYIESWCPDIADQKHISLKGLVEEHVVPLDLGNLSSKSVVYDLMKDYESVKILIEAFDKHFRQVANDIEGRDFDVLFVNSCVCFRTSAIAQYVNLPSLIYLGEPYRWYYEALPELPWLYPRDGEEGIRQDLLDGIRLQARYELECAKSFDLLLANSIYTRETLLRTYNLESKVCYLGIDLDHFQSTGEDVENFVMGLGTIYHAKGVDRAIRAIAQVDSKIRPELVWVGNGAWEENLKEYKKLALELKVCFIPKLKISDDEVRSLLSRAAVFMYTSRLEPFGLAPLEANACGTPVVAISEGGVKETIVDGVNGFIVKEEDFVLLGDKVELLVGNRDLRNELSEKSVQYVRECWGFEVGIDNIEKYLIDVSSSDFVAKSSIFKEGNENGVVMYGIDRFELIEGRLCMEGWAFVDDGGCANNWNIFVVVNSGGKELVYPCKKIFRQDVIDECGGSGEVGFNCEGFVESGVVSVRLLLDNGNSVFIQKL